MKSKELMMKKRSYTKNQTYMVGFSGTLIGLILSVVLPDTLHIGFRLLIIGIVAGCISYLWDLWFKRTRR